MRSLLYKAAVVILTRSRTNSDLRNWGIKLREKIGFKRSAFAHPQARRHHACDAPLRWADVAAIVKRVAEYVNAIPIARSNISPMELA